MATVEALRERLRALAEASGMPVPPMVVDDVPEGSPPLATVGRVDGGDVIRVSSTLLDAGTATQDWHLAACLGFWHSPTPRRTRRRGWLVLGLAIAVNVGFSLASLFSNVHVPKLLLFVTVPLLGFLLPFGAVAIARHFQRALDEAGLAVLTDAGHDPRTIARQVFEGKPDPSWWTRVRSGEPTPSERVAPFLTANAEVHPPLH